MPKDQLLTRDSFDSLLAWLDSEREAAGEKYEKIRGRLIQIFYNRGLSDAETLADETINRVAGKVGAIAGRYEGNPALYFYGVAQKVCLEAHRRKPAETIEPLNPVFAYQPAVVDEDSDEFTFRRQNCFNKCLAALSGDDRRLTIEYYASEFATNIDHRQNLARRFGLTLNALRVRAFRVRRRLQDCVSGCLNGDAGHQ